MPNAVQDKSEALAVSDCEELDRIIASIIKTTKENINNNSINAE
jgi:hypothetical protein